MRSPFLIIASLAFLACSSDDEASNNDSLPGASTAVFPEPPELAATISGFETPESVKYDPELDVYFVTNINGAPTARDDNGFITRVHADSLGFPLMRWVASGRNRVQLHAPKGMAIVGDTLWVADIDQLRGFHRRTGDPVRSVDLGARDALFLNDVAVGPDGALYVTDTGIRIGPDGTTSSPASMRVFRVADGEVAIALSGESLAGPNGIAWASGRESFVIASFGAPKVLGWKVGDGSPTVITTGPGGYDGIQVTADGRILVSSWADSSLYMLSPDGGELVRIISGIEAPADFGWDEGRQRVAIPLLNENRVVFYDLDGG